MWLRETMPLPISSSLSSLLEIQELDFAATAAQKRSDSLPERHLLIKLSARITRSRAELAAAQAEREQIEKEEEALGASVAELNSAIEAADVERYSGKRIDRDEASEHDTEQTKRRGEKTAIEEKEMELLESMEAVEGKASKIDAEIKEIHAEGVSVQSGVRAVEAEVAAELEEIAKKRVALATGLPGAVMTAYDRVRAQKGKAGRGGTSLSEGSCGACSIKLPSLEFTRMRDEPAEALIQCPQCRRLLIRG